jgi:hypothetical protein
MRKTLIGLVLVILIGAFWTLLGSFLAREPNSAEALPGTARATFHSVGFSTSQGVDVSFPSKEVICTLVGTRTESEGIYECPAPYDLSQYAPVPEPQTSRVPPTTPILDDSGADSLSFIKSAVVVSGLPANSWQTLQIQYGLWLTGPFVTLGNELTKGETGHIEHFTLNPDTTRGVANTYFYMRGQTNGSGYLGTDDVIAD